MAYIMAKGILKSLEFNRKIAENAIFNYKKQAMKHKHGIFCFNWRHCRKLEKTIAEIESKINDYREAEKELKNNIFYKLKEIVDCINSSPKQAREYSLDIVNEMFKIPLGYLESLKKN